MQAMSVKDAGSNNKNQSICEKEGSFAPNKPALDPPLLNIFDGTKMQGRFNT